MSNKYVVWWKCEEDGMYERNFSCMYRQDEYDTYDEALEYVTNCILRRPGMKAATSMVIRENGAGIFYFLRDKRNISCCNMMWYRGLDNIPDVSVKYYDYTTHTEETFMIVHQKEQCLV